MKSAIVAADGLVANVIEGEADTAAHPGCTVIYPAPESVGPGDLWKGGDVFEPATDPRPALIVTAIEPDPQNAPASAIAGTSEVTCPAGAVVRFTAELRAGDGTVLPLSDAFRMPMVASDGRERVLLAHMNEGIVTVVIPFRESGIWAVTEASINSVLPREMQMRFAGVTAYVFDAVTGN